QGVAPPRIELAEDVVDEHHRRLPPRFEKEVRLPQFQGEGDGSLLALARELGRRHAVQGQEEVVAMRPGGGLAAAQLLVAAGCEPGEEIVALPARAFVVEGERLSGAADAGLRLGGAGPQPLDEDAAAAREDLA